MKCLKPYWHDGNIINRNDIGVCNLLSVHKWILLPSPKITLWSEEIDVNLEFSKPLEHPSIGKRFMFASCIYLIIVMQTVSRSTLKFWSFKWAKCDYGICILFVVQLKVNKNCFLNVKRYWCLLVVFIKITSNSLLVTTKAHYHLHCNVVLCYNTGGFLHILYLAFEKTSQLMQSLSNTKT